MVVFALCDIDPYVELFASYGEEWWVNPEESVESPVPDKHILTIEEYEKLYKEYEAAVMRLFV